MSSRRAVKIRNPIEGPGWTSVKQAIKYVARGQARLVGENEIEFIESDLRSLNAVRTMKAITEPAPAGPTVPAAPAPKRGPVLVVVAASEAHESLRTFAPYPTDWEGYQKAA